MILIVDDKQENLLSLRSLLISHSFPVDTAQSGEEALKKVLKNTYALIMLDVQMPGMDGFEVAETISTYSKTKDVPIIFLSAINTDKKYITRGFTSGAVDYIAKPIDPDILLLKVNTLYRLYEQKRQLNEMQTSLRSEVEFRKKAQIEAYEKALELKVILESIPQIAFTLDTNGHIEFRNSKWYRYIHDQDEFPQTHPDDPGIQNAISQTIQTNGTLEIEVRLKANGQASYRYHLLRMLPMREDKKIIKWVGTFTDIEEQKQAVRKKDEFISVASHELKTPLTTLQGYMQLLDRQLSPDDTAALYLKRSLAQVGKLDALIADLLDISKIENGKLKLQESIFKFSEVVTEVVETVSQTFPKHNLEVQAHADSLVLADKSRIEQVLFNFISNAFKYSPADQPAQLIISHYDSNGLRISVKDYGIGIPAAEQSFVFDKFYRTEISQVTAQGLGIGLYICADILRRHHCEFGVVSEPGHGSEFYFMIPGYDNQK